MQFNNKVKLVSARVITDDLPAFDHNAILYVYTVNGVEVRGLHWSGKFNGSASALAAWLHVMAKRFNVDYVTTTETQQRGARRAIKGEFGVRWGIQMVGEYALIFNKDTFRHMKKARPRTYMLTKVLNWALWRQMHLGVFDIHHDELGLRFHIIDIHGPSAIEDGDNMKPGKQSEIAKTGWPRVGRRLKRFQKRHPDAVQIVVSDTNGDHRRNAWMLRFETWLGAISIWRLGLPKNGTHHGRVIDGAFIYGATIDQDRKEAA